MKKRITLAIGTLAMTSLPLATLALENNNKNEIYNSFKSVSNEISQSGVKKLNDNFVNDYWIAKNNIKMEITQSENWVNEWFKDSPEEFALKEEMNFISSPFRLDFEGFDRRLNITELKNLRNFDFSDNKIEIEITLTEDQYQKFQSGIWKTPSNTIFNIYKEKNIFNWVKNKQIIKYEDITESDLENNLIDLIHYFERDNQNETPFVYNEELKRYRRLDYEIMSFYSLNGENSPEIQNDINKKANQLIDRNLNLDYYKDYYKSVFSGINYNLTKLTDLYNKYKSIALDSENNIPLENIYRSFLEESKPLQEKLEIDSEFFLAKEIINNKINNSDYENFKIVANAFKSYIDNDSVKSIFDDHNKHLEFFENQNKLIDQTSRFAKSSFLQTRIRFKEFLEGYMIEIDNYLEKDKTKKTLRSTYWYSDDFKPNTEVISTYFTDVYYKGKTFTKITNENYKKFNLEFFKQWSKENYYSYWMSHPDVTVYENPRLQLSNRANELSYFFKNWRKGTVWDNPDWNSLVAKIYNNIYFTNMGSDLGYTVTYNPNISENIKIVKLDRVNDRGTGKVNQTAGLVDFDEGYRKVGRPINSFVEFAIVGLNGVKIENGEEVYIGEESNDGNPLKSSISIIKMPVKPKAHLSIKKLEDFQHELYQVEKEVSNEKWFNWYQESDEVDYILDSYNRGSNLFSIYNFYNSFAHYYDLMKNSRQTRMRNLTDAEIIDGFNKASFTEKDEALAKLGYRDKINFSLHIDNLKNHYVIAKYKNRFGINIEKSIRIDDAYKLDNAKYNKIVLANDYYKEFLKYRDWKNSRGNFSINDIKDDFNYKSRDESRKDQEIYESFGGLIPKIKTEGISGRVTKLELVDSGEIYIDRSRISYKNYWANYNEPLNEALKSKTKLEKIDYLVYRYFNAFLAWKRQSYEILLEKAFMPDKVKYYDNNAEKMKIYFKEFENGWYINKWEEPNNIRKALKELGLKNFKFIIHKNEHEYEKFDGYHWDAFFTYKTENKNNLNTSRDIFLNRNIHVFDQDTDTKVSFGIPHGDYNPNAVIERHVEDYPWFPKYLSFYFDRSTIDNATTYEYSDVLSVQNGRGNYEWLMTILDESRINWSRHADRRKSRETWEKATRILIDAITNPIGWAIEKAGGPEILGVIGGIALGFVPIPGYQEFTALVGTSDLIIDLANGGFSPEKISSVFLESMGMLSSFRSLTSANFRNSVNYNSKSKIDSFAENNDLNLDAKTKLDNVINRNNVNNIKKSNISLSDTQIQIANKGIDDMKLFDSFDLNNLGAVGGREYIVYPVTTKQVKSNYDFFENGGSNPARNPNRNRRPKNWGLLGGAPNDPRSNIDILATNLKDWLASGDLKSIRGNALQEGTWSYLWASAKIDTFQNSMYYMKNRYHVIPNNHIDFGVSLMTHDQLIALKNDESLLWSNNLIDFIDKKANLRDGETGAWIHPQFSTMIDSMPEYENFRKLVKTFDTELTNSFEQYNYDENAFKNRVIDRWEMEIEKDNTRYHGDNSHLKWRYNREDLENYYNIKNELRDAGYIEFLDRSFVDRYFDSNLELAWSFRYTDSKLKDVIKRQSSIIMGIAFDAPISPIGSIPDVRNYLGSPWYMDFFGWIN
ncbi:MAG: hypothetical protein HRT99_03620 [Mycoplasmatales bacterium]|nr:hypothetical protein [Mycoplasmatales bacterium]